MRYTLIPLTDTALTIGATAADLEGDGLAQAFGRTIETCELLVAFAVWVAGKPSNQ